MRYGTPVLPDIYEFTDFRQYLSAWFLAKKETNRRYSHRMFARHAGQKSPSLLLSVIEGRRNLTPATVDGFIAALGLTAPEASFFSHLVQLDQAKTADARNRAWRKIAATRRFREARVVEGAGMSYLSHWFIPATRELAACADFRADPEWIAKTLRPEITVPQARRALDTLVALGMMEVHPSGKATLREASVATPHEVADLGVHNYHNGMLDRARDALLDFPQEERHFLGVTIAIPEGMLPTLKQELNAFQAHVLDLCDEAQPAAERVFQVNLNLFPLSAGPQ
jgi:uncharacterized protein (TIGR02147 family)